jgi:uncharacterized protein (TIGR03437 family)
MTLVSNFPLVNPLYSSPQQDANFVSKLNSTGKALVYSTFFPGCSLAAIAVDAAGNAYVAGSSSSNSSTAFPIKNAFQAALQGSGDAVLTAFSPDGSSLLYSTFVGATASAAAIASDAAGDVYLTGKGLGLPVGSSAFQPNPNGYPDAFVFAYSAVSGPSVATVSAASFAVGVALTPNSIAAAFGTHLATQTASASGMLGTNLGGTTVNITDASNVTTPAPIFFVSAGQVNFLVPAGIALGAGQVQITASDGTVSVGALPITGVAPGLFTADGTVPVGSILQIDGQGNQTYTNLAQYNSTTGKFFATPINLGPASTQTFLIIYGTGIRNAPLSQIAVSVGGQTVTPAFAGIQGTFAGLDQVNLGIPHSLAGTGDVAISLTAGGITSNPVHVTVQ